MLWNRPSPKESGRARGAPADRQRRAVRVGLAARMGAPSLIAVASALTLLALLCAALLVPGFVRPAGAETTSTTQVAPVDTPPSDPAPAEPAPGRRLVTLPWGDGVGEVGLAQPAEGLTRGPEALAVAPDGRIAVLDSVNSRLVLLADDGSLAGTVALALSQPRFLAVDDATIYVLDADSDRRLVCMDWQGAAVHTASLPAVDDVVTGLFVTGDGPCVEVAHDDVFLVEFKDEASQTAKAEKTAKATLRATAGRPVDRDLGNAVKVTFKPKDGIKLKSYKVDKKTLKGAQTRIAAPRLPGGKVIEHLVSVDGDGNGDVIIGARLLRSKGDPENEPSLVVGRMALGASQADPAPVLTDSVTLCDSPFAYLGQPYVVAPDGRIFQPVGSEEGYTIMVLMLPGSAGTEEVQP